MNHVYTHWPKYLAYMIGVSFNRPPVRLLVYRMNDGTISILPYPVK